MIFDRTAIEMSLTCAFNQRDLCVLIRKGPEHYFRFYRHSTN